MNIEKTESDAAESCLDLAQIWALNYFPRDQEAATVAILMRAIELATPDMSPDRRASLFNGDSE